MSLPVMIQVDGKRNSSGNGKTRDVSTSGIFFTIDRDLAAGDELGITLTLPSKVTRGQEVFIQATGKVVRVEKRAVDGSSRAGIGAIIDRYEIIRHQPATL
jgi:hypothetical protein